MRSYRLYSVGNTARLLSIMLLTGTINAFDDNEPANLC